MFKFILLFTVLFNLVSCLENESAPRRPEATPTDNPGPQTPTDTDSDFNLEDTLPSLFYRDRGTKSIPLMGVRKALAAGDLPTGLYMYPKQVQTMDSEVIYQAHKYNNCGFSEEITTVKDSITNCLEANPANATWDATQNGTSGEADWKLVYVGSDDLIIWQDQRTGLLWTNIIQQKNFKEARDEICQNSFTLENTLWKLPNRNEFLMADINGARFVLDETDNIFWTETASINNNKAWAIKQDTGVLIEEDVDNSLNIRCVGVSLTNLL